MSTKDGAVSVPVCTQCGIDSTRIQFKDRLSLEGEKNYRSWEFFFFNHETKVLYSMRAVGACICLSECTGTQLCRREHIGASLNTRHVRMGLVVTPKSMASLSGGESIGSNLSVPRMSPLKVSIFFFIYILLVSV